MNLINKIELQGRVNSDLKEKMIGPKANFLTIFFMLKWEGDQVSKKDGTKFTPGVSCAVSSKGKLAESVKRFKKGDLVSVVGQLRIDVKEDELTKQKTYFPKIEAVAIEALVEQVIYDEGEDLPF